MLEIIAYIFVAISIAAVFFLFLYIAFEGNLMDKKKQQTPKC